ncbi:hypothetical protein TrCOL_g11094 [Triparma columacea]|uniref:Uncharacterized protein n=1 Tax=Triparma columacea TaxID=722753 RepID=A0A9W7GKI1_9STRA|nr:hypothetical protein TrCOL_g11094 [Triparma columacea]
MPRHAAPEQGELLLSEAQSSRLLAKLKQKLDGLGVTANFQDELTAIENLLWDKIRLEDQVKWLRGESPSSSEPSSPPMMPAMLTVAVLTPLTDLELLCQSYISAIKKSSFDTRRDIEKWFDANFPSFKESGGRWKTSRKNIRTFLVELAVKLRPMLKMFRVGLGLRLFLIAASSYVDMATDVLVTVSFFQRGANDWGYASLSCVSLGIGFQVLFAFIQYRGLGFRRCITMLICALLGLLPLFEAWYVFRGVEQTSGMAFEPIFMLATTKGLEITFEALPESIIQCIAMLSSKPEEITLVNYIGIASSLAATGLIISDANLSISRTFERGAPNNPQYNWIPKERKSLLLCIAGYAIFTTFYFTSNVLALSLALLYFGGTVMSTAIAVEIVIVMLYKHYIDEALFGFSLSPKPSKLDYVLGPITKFIQYVLSFVSYISLTKNPTELGAHVTSALIVWRMASCSALVLLTLPTLSDGRLPWLSLHGGIATYSSCLLLSWVGALMYWGNMTEEHEKWRWWRRQTGVDFINEVWDTEFVWYAECGSKEEDLVLRLMSIHPINFPMERIRFWVCDELVDKYGGKTTGEPLDSDNSGELSGEESGEEVKSRGSGRRLTRASRGEFITQEFKDRMITVFTWWNRQCITSAHRQEALRDVKDALDMIPTFIPPLPIESQRTTRQVTIRGSGTGRVAPEPLPSGETKAET